MSAKASKQRLSWRDHLTAYLVLILIVGIVVVGGFGLYVTGIFDPVEITPALVNTKPMDLATPPPSHVGLLDWLFPSAYADEAVEAPAAAPQSQDELSTLLEQIVAEEVGEEEITDAQRVTVDKTDLALNENLPDTVYNVLLLATDSRDINAKNGRSDVMIIASLNMQANEIKLSSLSRDMWVPIPNSVGNNKLNSAFAFGGANLAMKTVNQNFELNIQDYVVVNFATMAGIVDSLGGLDIYLEGMEYSYINYNVAVSEDYEGFAKSTSRSQLSETDVDKVVHLDGLQAVSYARIRKMDSDFQRGSRQRIVLQAMMDKALQNLSPSTFYSLASNMINSTSTNIKLTQVMDIGTWLLAADSFPSMSELSVPIAGSFHGDREKDMDVIKYNQAQNVQALHEFIYGEYIPAAAAK